MKLTPDTSTRLMSIADSEIKFSDGIKLLPVSSGSCTLRTATYKEISIEYMKYQAKYILPGMKCLATKNVLLDRG